MIVIGGSNSAEDGIKNHRCLYHQLFSQWWDSDFNNDWLQVDGRKFVTWRDRKRFLYILPAEFHNNRCWTRCSIYRVISKRLWMRTRCNSAAHGTPHATSIILEIISISSVDLVKKGASLSTAKNPRCHNLEDLGQYELATHYGITLRSWRDNFVQWIQLMASGKPSYGREW